MESIIKKKIIESKNNNNDIKKEKGIKNIIKIKNNICFELCKETSKILKDKQSELSNIKWKNGESNLDTEYSELSCKCCELAWNEIKKKYPEYNKIEINCQKPDINITFVYPNKDEEKFKIELKSSKSEKMIGSTIRKLDINQPLIYCLRPNNTEGIYKIR